MLLSHARKRRPPASGHSPNRSYWPRVRRLWDASVAPSSPSARCAHSSHFAAQSVGLHKPLRGVPTLTSYSRRQQLDTATKQTISRALRRTAVEANSVLAVVKSANGSRSQSSGPSLILSTRDGHLGRPHAPRTTAAPGFLHSQQIG